MSKKTKEKGERIIEFRDHLNDDEILVRFPWLLECKFRNAVLGQNEETGKLIWYKGEWIEGTWEDGTWLSGTWHNGIWKSGFWQHGKWLDGNWKGGRWLSGTWHNGTWDSGMWQNGIWMNGTWKGGEWRMGTWKKGNQPKEKRDKCEFYYGMKIKENMNRHFEEIGG